MDKYRLDDETYFQLDTMLRLRARLEEATQLLREVAATRLLRKAAIDADLCARVAKFIAAPSDAGTV